MKERLKLIFILILTLIIISIQNISYANSVTYKFEYIGENTINIILETNQTNKYIAIRSVSPGEGKNLSVNYAIVDDINQKSDNITIDCRLFALIPPIRILLLPVDGYNPVFDDIANRPEEIYIQHLHDAGIIKGYDGNIFKPEDSITRVEFFTMIVKALKYNIAQNYTDEFIDLKGHWGKNYIMAAVENNLAQGNGDGTISPDIPITSGQVALILDRAFNFKNLKDGVYSKLLNPAHYATSSIKKLLDSDIIKLDDSTYKEFDIDRPASRAECATMISRALVYQIGDY